MPVVLAHNNQTTRRCRVIRHEDYRVEDTSRAHLQASPEGVRSFLEARHGLSMHWGLYALNGRGEWVMHAERIPFATYRERMSSFNPTRFCAEEWADLMLEGGLKFLLITAKHHDGFCLWDSALTDFKVTNTPLGRDVLAELAPALRERGLKLHLYYSLLDWTRPSYRDDWPAYVAYYQGHLRELLTNYGELGGILFDGYWPRFRFDAATAHFAPGGPWDLAGTYDLIHQLQPGAVITNNTHVLPLKGEDYQVWELDMPGENTAGFNTTDVGDLPKAVWWNLNAGWAYAPRTHDVKSTDTILRALRKANARGAVFMLNVGPRPYGDIHPDEQRVLREVGQTLRTYGL
jgi:alpha-L-fucosidase